MNLKYYKYDVKVKNLKISNNRKWFNEIVLPKFIDRLVKESVVLDIGKSENWFGLYREMFSEFDYKTIDKDPTTKPDICLDIEFNNGPNALSRKYADAIVCHGVIEQCENPFALTQKLSEILKKDGLILFTFISLGYPDYSIDNLRFTLKGSAHILQNYFEIIDTDIVTSLNTTEAIFHICRNKY